MHRVFILVTFFTLTPLFIFSAIVGYGYLGYSKTDKLLFPLIGSTKVTKPLAYAALPTNADVIVPSITTQDTRIDSIRNFLTQHNSPMVNYTEFLVTEADQYHVDPRLIVAIAMQESGLCRTAIPGTNNCFGWGIHGGQVQSFDDIGQGIDIVTRGLAKNYIQKGLTTPQMIGPKYNPLDYNGWTAKVTAVMNEI